MLCIYGVKRLTYSSFTLIHDVTNVTESASLDGSARVAVIEARCYLPPADTRFIGREEDIAEVVGNLTEVDPAPARPPGGTTRAGKAAKKAKCLCIVADPGGC